MNDEDKIFAVSELFVVEMERWYVRQDHRKVEEYSDEDKCSEIIHLERVITEAKQILDKPKDIFDSD